MQYHGWGLTPLSKIHSESACSVRHCKNFHRKFGSNCHKPKTLFEKQNCVLWTCWMIKRSARLYGYTRTWGALWWTSAGKGVLWKIAERIPLRAETRLYTVWVCCCLSQGATIKQLHPSHCQSSSHPVKSSRCPGTSWYTWGLERRLSTCKGSQWIPHAHARWASWLWVIPASGDLIVSTGLHSHLHSHAQTQTQRNMHT